MSQNGTRSAKNRQIVIAYPPAFADPAGLLISALPAYPGRTTVSIGMVRLAVDPISHILSLTRQASRSQEFAGPDE